MPKPRRALVIEGGGMKAAYANGVLTSFEQAGYHPWDVVVGTSAGGAMAAWYSAGQAEWAEGTWVYARDPRVLNYRRWLTRRGPLLDHEALLDIVYVQERPLDLEAVRKATWPVIVTAVDADTGQMTYVDIRDRDIITWLKATGRLPFACGPPVEIDGHRWLDGGVVDPVPTRYAVEGAGATDITLITNKALGPKKSDARPLIQLATRRYPPLRDGMVHHQQIKWDSVQFALHPPPGITGRVVAPSAPTRTTRLGRDLEAIQAAIELGHHDGAAFLR